VKESFVVGYSDTSTYYNIYNLAKRKIVVSRDVKFQSSKEEDSSKQRCEV
jgi:hypothetical protein